MMWELQDKGDIFVALENTGINVIFHNFVLKIYAMIINIEKIKKNSGRIIGMMRQMRHYSFEELQYFTRLGSTELCQTLILLVQESKIEQSKDEFSACYALNW